MADGDFSCVHILGYARHSEHIHICAPRALVFEKTRPQFFSFAACLFQFWQGAARYLAFKIYEWRLLADWICELRIRAVWSQTRIRKLKCVFRPARILQLCWDNLALSLNYLAGNCQTEKWMETCDANENIRWKQAIKIKYHNSLPCSGIRLLEH